MKIFDSPIARHPELQKTCFIVLNIFKCKLHLRSLELSLLNRYAKKKTKNANALSIQGEGSKILGRICSYDWMEFIKGCSLFEETSTARDLIFLPLSLVDLVGEQRQRRAFPRLCYSEWIEDHTPSGVCLCQCLCMVLFQNNFFLELIIYSTPKQNFIFFHNFFIPYLY